MHDHELQRRMLLRSMLAAGALFIPMVGRAKPGATGTNAVIAKTTQAQAL